MEDSNELKLVSSDCSRRDFLKKAAGAVATAPLLTGCKSRQQNQPSGRNIVLILVDDMRFDAQVLGSFHSRDGAATADDHRDVRLNFPPFDAFGDIHHRPAATGKQNTQA